MKSEKFLRIVRFDHKMIYEFAEGRRVPSWKINVLSRVIKSSDIAGENERKALDSILAFWSSYERRLKWAEKRDKEKGSFG